jgi:hypothetical protein
VSATAERLRALGADSALGLYRNVEVLADPAVWTDKPISVAVRVRVAMV